MVAVALCVANHYKVCKDGNIEAVNSNMESKWISCSTLGVARLYHLKYQFLSPVVSPAS